MPVWSEADNVTGRMPRAALRGSSAAALHKVSVEPSGAAGLLGSYSV